MTAAAPPAFVAVWACRMSTRIVVPGDGVTAEG
jgi:hypothetical protein